MPRRWGGSWHWRAAHYCHRPFWHLPEVSDGQSGPDIIFGRWFEHVKGWLTIKDNPNFLILSYEDMLKDLRSNVIKIIKFLGKELDDAAIDSVVEHSSFQAMKNNPMSNYSAVPNAIFSKEHGSFHRKGIAGDHKNHFTPAQEEEFEKIYKDCMKDINFSFA
ncbi:unnamed protein product [Ranitomeya imitator]|uniref:Sulfotransferase n=1 Tax=Ranitomeya imitator TaxID=111125 RepID=A0ABN9M8H5_9NEOB|nr:unnamed protein product [Ranitomeya imitator]